MDLTPPSLPRVERVPTLSRALVAPRWVLSTLEVAATFFLLLFVFGLGLSFLVVVAATLTPLLGLLAIQYMLEQRRQVRPIELLAARGLAGALTADERSSLAEALVAFPRRVVYVRFMAWAATAAALVVACSALGDLSPSDLGAVGGVCFAIALVFLMLRAYWFRVAAERALLPALPGLDLARYLGRTVRERLFVAAVLPAAVGALLAGLYDWLFLQPATERVRDIFAFVPFVALAITLGFARQLFRWTGPIRAHLAGRPLAGPHDGPLKLRGPHVEDPGAAATLEAASRLPSRAAALFLGLWTANAALLALGRGLTTGPWQEGVLLFAGLVAVGIAGTLVQLVWSRAVLQPARSQCVRALGQVSLEQLGPPVRVRDRFIAAMLAVLFASSTFAYTTLYLQQRAFVSAAAGAEAKAALDDLWPSLEPLARLGRSERLARLVTLAPTLDEQLALVDEGRLVWSTKPLPLALEEARQIAYGAREVSLGRARRTLALRPLGDDGAVAVFRPWRNFEGVYSVTGLTLLFLVLAVIALAMALLAAQDFTRPIQQLRHFARRLGRGELDAPVPVPDADEVGELGLTLDKMRADLRQQLDAVRELNQSLERKVAERTAELERTLAELHATQAQMLHAEKMASVGRLAAGVAHEVNNPLNFIANSLSPLEQAIDELRQAALPDGGRKPDERHLRESAEDTRELLRLLRNGVQRTQQIVRGLRDFARKDEGEPLRETDLGQLCDQTVALLRHELAGRIEVVREYAEDTRIACYPGAMGQLLMNLLANAVQAIRGPGTITLTLRREAGALELRVRDTGCGIPPDVLPKIFDPFFTTKEVGKGTGLGLSIAHGIVERHGGRIQAESAPGTGTEFRVLLPAGREPVAKIS